MKNAKDILRDEIEPVARQSAIFLPMWIFGLLCVATCWGFNYVSAHGGSYDGIVYTPYISTNELATFIPVDEFGAAMKLGGQVYGQYCMGCHQPSGSGQAGIAPPLAGSEWVNAKGPNRIVRIPIRGLGGPIKVKGADYNLNMFAVGAMMSDDQIAGVLTFVRNSWGNKADMVTPEQVAKVRGQIANHPEAFTPAELEKEAEGP